MLQTRVMPCLLLNNSKLVKTVKFKNPNYIGDPVNAVKIYNDKEVDELIFLDISATPNNKPPSLKAIREIADECFMPMTYGGGIRTIQDMKNIYNLGVEKIAINSYAIDHLDIIREASDIFGGQSVVVSIDVKKKMMGGYEVYSQSGKKASRHVPVEWASKVQAEGAGEILLTSIDRDGTYEGYDFELIKLITDAVSIPVIVSGGAGKLSDFTAAVQNGASACAIGSMAVYQGKGKGVLINFPSPEDIRSALP